MNIILQEIKMSYKSFLSYTLGMIVTMYLFLSLFHSFAENAVILDEILSNFPAEFRAAFGFSDINMAQVDGFLSFLFNYIILIGAIYSMKLGVSLLSEEVRVKTSDFLLSKPVKRSTIFFHKVSTIFIFVILQNILVYLFTLLDLALFMKNDVFSYQVITLMSFSLFLVQLFFIGIGLCLSVVIKKIKAVMPITLSIVFLFFIIDLINQSLREKKLTYLTPFSYFKGADLIQQKQYDLTYVLIDIAVFLTFSGICYIVYQKKDMPSI